MLYDPSDHARTMIDPAQDLAPRLHSHSEVRTYVTLPKGRQAIAEARTAAPEHRAELERFAEFYAKGALGNDEYKELRPRILGLSKPEVMVTSSESREGNMIVIQREADPSDPDAG